MFMDYRGIYRQAQTRRVTTITREYNENGNLVKETEVVTEYDEPRTAPWQNPPLVTYTC